MKKYRVKISPEANDDIQGLFNVIAYGFKSYNTAERYVKGLRKTIKDLKNTAGAYRVQTRPFFLQYGLFVYRVNYKKMAVVYTIENDLVVIRRIVPSNIIAGL